MFGFDVPFLGSAFDRLNEEVTAYAVVVHIEGSADLITEAIGEEDGVRRLGIVESDNQNAFAIIDCAKDGIETRIGGIDGVHVSSRLRMMAMQPHSWGASRRSLLGLRRGFRVESQRSVQGSR